MWPLWELKGLEEMKHFVQPRQDEAGNCGNQCIFKGFSQVTGQKDHLWTCVFQPENESLHSAVTCFLYLLCWWWSRSWQQLGPGKIFAPTPSWRSLFGNSKLEGGGCRIPVKNNVTVTEGGCKRGCCISSWTGGKVISVGAERKIPEWHKWQNKASTEWRVSEIVRSSSPAQSPSLLRPCCLAWLIAETSRSQRSGHRQAGDILTSAGRLKYMGTACRGLESL